MINTIKYLYSNAKFLNGIESQSTTKIENGLIQGSILSPSLFNRYINGLLPKLRNGWKPNMWADDLAKIH